MASGTHYRLHVRSVLFAVVILGLILIAGAVVAAAIDLFPGLPNDGRVNVVHHFGGDALYCVDGNRNPMADYPSDDFGGMQLLNIDGQELWFIAAADIDAFVAQAQANPGVGVLMLEAPSSYGTSYLYVFTEQDQPDIVKFRLVANDEWGKQNTIEFNSCKAVGPTSSPGSVDLPSTGELCDTETIDEYCSCIDAYCHAAAVSVCGGDDACVTDVGTKCYEDLTDGLCAS